jgi:AraC-like DNA-binding protein
MDQVLQFGELRSLLISAMSSLVLLSLGSIGLSPEWRVSKPTDHAPDGPLQPTEQASEPVQANADCLDGADPALLARLDAYMCEARPWINPDLTLVALARKLGVPSKTLSAAVNLGHGENMARYVNRHRIAHACALLVAGQSVNSAVYDSGFNTKSNFHREFQRIHHQTPSQWLAQNVPPRRGEFSSPADETPV